jgi:hypothetical protein
MVKERARVPGILTEDPIDGLQGLDGAEREVGQVANRRADDVQPTYHVTFHGNRSKNPAD